MFQFVENCKEFFTRIVRCLIELRTVRSLIHENCNAVVIELRAVRSLLGELCRCFIELRTVRSLLGEL